MTALVLVMLSQIQFGGDAGVAVVRRINCSGAGLNCSASGTVGTIVAAAGATVPAACNSGEAVTSNGEALVCTAALTASGLVCSGTCVSDAEISAVAASKLTGTVAAANGGTGLGAPIDDAVLVGTSSNLYSSAILPNCTDTGGQHLNYIAASNAFSCGTTSSGGGGGGNFVEADVDFGGGADVVTATVAASWVSDSSKIVCAPTLLATADRLEGAEDAVIEGLTVASHTRVVGVGFSVTVAPRMGRAFGRFLIHCTGG